MALIQARQLTKRFRVPVKAPGLTGAIKHVAWPRYKDRLAVDAVDLSIQAGESVAYVGPNGAGKSTTVKMLTGILVPTTGEVRVRGLVPYRQRVDNARNIGVVFGQRSQLWWDLPVQESLRLLGDIYQVPPDVFRRNFVEFTELLDLGPLLPTPVRQLSLGQRMRCDLAAALLHSPPILYLDEAWSQIGLPHAGAIVGFPLPGSTRIDPWWMTAGQDALPRLERIMTRPHLDEPSIGLDVAVKARLREFIKCINRERGVTVLLTSHDMGDIEGLCERIIMIDRGRIIFDGPLQAIKDRFGRERTIHFVLSEVTHEAAERARSALRDLGPACVGQPELYRLAIQYDPT